MKQTILSLAFLCTLAFSSAANAQSVPEGNYRDNAGTVVHINAYGHYCWFQSPEDFARLGGGHYTQIDSFPYGLIYDGICR